tara:strand:- start:6496 stop:7461 length:966 start_codon:yes stop_codon:yes gene_type:complete
MSTRKLINYDDKPTARRKNADAKRLKTRSEENYTGVGEGVYDISSEFIKAPYEEVAAESRENNCYIVCGRDRECGPNSGYSGKATDAGAIDIVVGRFPDEVVKLKDPKTGKKRTTKAYANLNFIKDSARIYISQKADIDRYLNIRKHFNPHGESVGVSAIAVKADAVRIVGRHDIKLVTFTDPSTGNDQKDIKSAGGVHLMAGAFQKEPEHKSEKMVKGQSLKKFHNEVLIDPILDFLEHVKEFISRQQNINEVLLNHQHTGFMGWQTTPSTQLASSIPSEMLQCEAREYQDLEQLSLDLSNKAAEWLDQNKYLSQFHTVN